MGRRFCFVKKLSSMTGLALLLTVPVQGVTHIVKPDGKSNVSVSISYAPTFAGITDFKVGEAYDGSTRALVPYKQDSEVETLRSDHFDWLSMGDKISFENSSKTSIAGSIGLKLRGGAKLELEIGHESFPAHFRSSGIEQNGDSGLYLLAKDMAHAVVGDEKERLTDKLVAASREDLDAFAQALRIGDPDTYHHLFSADPQGFGLLLISHNIGNPQETLPNPLWVKGDTMIRKSEGRGYRVYAFVKSAENSLWNMIPENVKKGGDVFVFVTEQDKDRKRRPWTSLLYRFIAGGKSKDADRSLWQLSETGEVNVTKFEKDKKADVARFLTKTVEGGEVVELGNVSSTSVMLNTCYDVVIARQVLTPYACAGLGYSFVSVANSDPLPKLAYKLKLGVSVQVAPNVSAFAGGYYSKVLGGIKDMELSVLRLIDDYSPDGRTKDAALASFDLAYSGCEVGLNFVF